MFASSVIYIIVLYQKLVSPFLPQACRFHPSCSEYSIKSIRRHGLAKGVALTVLRLAKCHPLHPGGYDPVL